MNDKEQVTITPEAWGELYKIVADTLERMALWGQAFEQPPAVAVGAFAGMAEILADGTNACDCSACVYVADAFADELVSRWQAVRPTVN
jgi:hypothetical protein